MPDGLRHTKQGVTPLETGIQPAQAYYLMQNLLLYSVVDHKRSKAEIILMYHSTSGYLKEPTKSQISKHRGNN